MSPEQARGVKIIDKRTDIYSMGVILYELLSGELPFFSENPGDVMVMIVTKPERPLAERVPGLPRALSDVVARAMAKKPDDRFSDARTMQSALRDASESLRESPGVLEIGQRTRPSSWRRRSIDPTEAELPRTEAAPSSSSRPLGANSKRIVIAALSVALAGAALGVTVVLFGRSNAAAPSRFILVQADKPAEPAAAAPMPGHSTGVEIQSAENIETRRDVSKRIESDPAVRIADSFKRQKKPVVACVNDHAIEAERTPQLAVRITVGASGKVQIAKALPVSVAGSSMGACIERAVRAMQFPRQSAPLSFEVPLTTRKGD